jgi:hypothetical protein
MKNLTMNLTFAAATLVAAAGVASAQTMEANVPFAFRASGQVFAAGTYRINVQRAAGGNPLITIRGSDPHKQLLAATYPDGPAKAGWQQDGKAVLSFECGVSRCQLTKLWMGSDYPTLRVPAPKLGRDEPVHVTEISTHLLKGE